MVIHNWLFTYNNIYLYLYIYKPLKRVYFDDENSQHSQHSYVNQTSLEKYIYIYIYIYHTYESYFGVLHYMILCLIHYMIKWYFIIP